MRVRRREKMSDDEFAATYDHMFTGVAWPGHAERFDQTAAFIRPFLTYEDDEWIADLACGDASIVARLTHSHVILGDFVPAPHVQLVGDIMQLVCMIPDVRVFIATEIIEHLDDPDEFLRRVREKTQILILSTPLDETVEDNWHEHYWTWDKEDIGAMLEQAGFKTVLGYEEHTNYGFTFQQWAVR